MKLAVIITITLLILGLAWAYFDSHSLTISIKDIPAQELKGVFIP